MIWAHNPYLGFNRRKRIPKITIMARILVVDDNLLFLEMLCDILEDKGHEVISAPDGEIALKFFYEGEYDLIISDLIMPGKDGMEVITEIRKNFPNMKIIAISGGDKSFPASSYLSVTKSMGADFILATPFDRKDLLGAVDILLGSDNVS